MAISSTINEYNGFYLTPSDIRQVIYSYTDDKSFFNMIPVCQLFYTDLTNEFFENRCKALFLDRLVKSPFYDPFVKTIDCSWKAVLFCSTQPGTDRLDRAAKKLACMPLEKFKLHLSNNTIPHFQECIKPYEKKLQPICGRYYQDPDSQIHKAWEHVKANWTEQDQIDLKESTEKTSLEYSDRMFATAKRQDLDAFCDEQPFHFKRLPTLWQKKRNAYEEYDKVESLRCFLQFHIDKHAIIIRNYNKIINSPNHLEQYAASIFQVIMKGMSTKMKWDPHHPTFTEIKDTITIKRKHPFPSNQLTPEGTEEVHQLICSLPIEGSSLIWQKLYDRCANGVQEWQWSEKHFHEHPIALISCVNETLISILPLIPKNIDPTTNPSTLEPVLGAELEKMPIG